jgi:hypothetical protein
MRDLESQEEDASKRVLWHEVWVSLWQTFFAMSVGAQIPAQANLPPSLVVVKICNLMLLVTMLVLVPPTRVPFRTTHKVKTQ